MSRLAALLVVLAIAPAAIASDSVVIGRGISNAYFASVPCPSDYICLDGQYLWTFLSGRTVAGPVVHGEVRGIFMQHTEAKPQFVNAVELFVLRPIDDATLRTSSGADFYIIALSTRHTTGRYCLPMDPKTVHLHIHVSEISRDDGAYCFDAHLL